MGDSNTIPCFIGVCNSDWVIGNVDHSGVFNFVDGVAPNISHLSALRDQHDVVPL